MELRTLEMRILGDYNVIKLIGRGPLGSVYLAEHRFMKKQYALKVLPEELASDRAFIQRFDEEVAALAILDHPNIVKIHNISFSQGHYFLVTDCVVDDLAETTNLGQYVMGRSERLSEEELYQLLWQLADALDYAHSKKSSTRQLCHRGIKLNNILIGQASEKGFPTVHLSDFGLSRVVGSAAVLTRSYKMVAEALGASAFTTSSKHGNDRYPNPALDLAKLVPLQLSFLQNVAFLAPEQKRSDLASHVSGKADIYAFGVLAYYLLMGEFPEGYFEWPSQRRPELQYRWDQLLQGCLAGSLNRRADALLPLMEQLKSRPKIAAVSAAAQPLPAAAAPVTVTFAEVVGEIPLRPLLHCPQLELPQHLPDPSALLHCEAGVKQYIPERAEIRNVQPLLTEMVAVRGGYFWRGSSDGNRDEMPRHQVLIDSFAIDKHPVTNEQFVRFLDLMGGEKDSNHQDIIRLRDSRIKRSGGKLSIESGYSKHPVVGVTWYGAVAFAKWVGKRLPTEAEWEIAARGGDEGALFATGHDIEKSQANFFSSDTTAVMSYGPNEYGLFDMAGNVYEWCHDWYGYNYYESSAQEPENPTGPSQGVYRVLRGGCWKSLREDLRCSRRHRNNPGTVNGTYGFRCAADVE
jgi:formylglycine-generating enzyme required for sulfatase activity